MVSRFLCLVPEKGAMWQHLAMRQHLPDSASVVHVPICSWVNKTQLSAQIQGQTLEQETLTGGQHCNTPIYPYS